MYTCIIINVDSYKSIKNGINMIDLLVMFKIQWVFIVEGWSWKTEWISFLPYTVDGTVL